MSRQGLPLYLLIIIALLYPSAIYLQHSGILSQNEEPTESLRLVEDLKNTLKELNDLKDKELQQLEIIQKDKRRLDSDRASYLEDLTLLEMSKKDFERERS